MFPRRFLTAGNHMTLTYVSRRLKTGRQFGYMELEVWRGSPSRQPQSAELLAIGRHSKMLSATSNAMRAIEMAMNPRLEPLLSGVCVCTSSCFL